ncbi:hypothetical protein Taci_0577 [Thermanaerovibrio acidaminovorans DSM 6589]|uniref:Uncharacterized protein n=1 Tax=Thermanaerovibrio acidaminovorans (strain ATCC 49978 / DSM 6589 / Su883) TaxID=525903 RepID=D1B960_THEAS|nr:hypothetical protein [Thermanaerovibrio acidaminovorans]ACZ18813.1 hypothetical protein Taci_0577 [Thermanaerovibrio acidaminovorans DSM 6589]
MSRAFVREEDEDLLNQRYDEAYVKKRSEWLRIQRKKLAFLTSDPKAEEIDPKTRERWIEQTREDIERTQEELRRLGALE